MNVARMQLIDAGWIEQSTQRVSRGLRVWSGHSFDHGSLWWLTGDRSGGDVITASGALGPWIFISPRHQLVVSTVDHRLSTGRVCGRPTRGAARNARTATGAGRIMVDARGVERVGGPWLPSRFTRL
jgi:hypothetical protein